MSHFVCPGECRYVSDEPGTCKDAECPDFGKPLIACDCPDGQSHQVVRTAPEEEERES